LCGRLPNGASNYDFEKRFESLQLFFSIESGSKSHSCETLNPKPICKKKIILLFIISFSNSIRDSFIK
jgi:hypothetical protein